MNLELDRQSISRAIEQLSMPGQAFIGGKCVDAISGKTFVTENPATGQKLADVAECESADIDRAVESARHAFERGVWSRQKPAHAKRCYSDSPI